MKDLVAAGMLLLLPLVLAAQERAGCPAAMLYPKIDRAYHECSVAPNTKEEWHCDVFVSVFKQLLPEHLCHDPYDDEISDVVMLPTLWVLGSPPAEDYVELLSRLKSKEARCLFGSEEFRAALSVAADPSETYGAPADKAARLMKGKCNGL